MANTPETTSTARQNVPVNSPTPREDRWVWILWSVVIVGAVIGLFVWGWQSSEPMGDDAVPDATTESPADTMSESPTSTAP